MLRSDVRETVGAWKKATTDSYMGIPPELVEDSLIRSLLEPDGGLLVALELLNEVLVEIKKMPITYECSILDVFTRKFGEFEMKLSSPESVSDGS